MELLIMDENVSTNLLMWYFPLNHLLVVDCICSWSFVHVFVYRIPKWRLHIGWHWWINTSTSWLKGQLWRWKDTHLGKYSPSIGWSTMLCISASWAIQWLNPDFNGSLYGFDFRNYRSTTDLQLEEDGQFGM